MLHKFKLAISRFIRRKFQCGQWLEARSCNPLEP